METISSPGINLEDNRDPDINRCTTIGAVLAILALMGRLTARRLKGVVLGASDYTVIVGCFTECGSTGLMYIGECIPVYETLTNIISQRILLA